MSGAAGNSRRRPVGRIDTHGAAVFLAGDRALKIKRAVKFPYFDYSTLARRKEACDQEFQVNRLRATNLSRLRPDHSAARRRIFGSAATARWSSGRWRWRGSTRQHTVDRLARAGSLDIALSHATAEVIAASHRAAPSGPRALDRAVERIIDDNSAAFRAGAFHRERSPRSMRQAAPRSPATGRCWNSAPPRVTPPVPWRPAPRQHRGDRRQAGAVRRHRVRSPFASADVLYDLAFALMDFLQLRAAATQPRPCSTAISE